MTIFLTEADAARLGIAGAAKRTKRSAPGLDRPARAKPGDGDRVPDLMRLAAAGWTRTNYCHATGEHWMSGARGETERYPSYRAMLDATLEAMR